MNESWGVKKVESESPFPFSKPQGTGVMAHSDPREASAFRTWRSRLAWFVHLQLLSLPVGQHSGPLLYIPLFFPTSSPFPPPHQSFTSLPYHHRQNCAHFQQRQTGPTSPTLAAPLSFLLCASPHQPFSSNTDLFGDRDGHSSGCFLVNI